MKNSSDTIVNEPVTLSACSAVSHRVPQLLYGTERIQAMCQHTIVRTKS
jgi:hypothetical protein